MVKFSHLRLYCKGHCSGRVDYGKQGQSLTNVLERIIDYVYYCHSMQRTPICHCLSVEIEFWLLASVWFKKKKKKLQQSQCPCSAKTQLTKNQFCANTVLRHCLGVSYVSNTNYFN